MRSLSLCRKVILPHSYVKISSPNSTRQVWSNILINCSVTASRSTTLNIQSRSMATTDLGPNGSLQGLTLVDEDASLKFPGCYPETNPIDVYRAHIASKLSEVTGVDTSIIYPSVQWTQTLDKGDLTIAIPALRVKGQNPTHLAEKWAKEVRL